MILCLKLLMFVADFSSEGRLFHTLGPKYERPFCPVLLFRKGLGKIDGNVSLPPSPYVFLNVVCRVVGSGNPCKQLTGSLIQSCTKICLCTVVTATSVNVWIFLIHKNLLNIKTTFTVLPIFDTKDESTQKMIYFLMLKLENN